MPKKTPEIAKSEIKNEGEKLQFKVSSALKSVIGRDLITNDFVAIFELVKNSIDAGASRIDLVFDLSLETKDPAIYVIDDGKGMSPTDIIEKWLFLAYSAKREGTEDKKIKTYAGNKGVGRFSCDRLGGKLELQTKTIHSDFASKITVNWGDFEKNSTTLFSKIDVSYLEIKKFEAIENFKLPKYGTILKISNLRDELSWDRKKIMALRTNLEKLINPFGENDKKIEVVIRCKREEDADQAEEQQTKDDDDASGKINGPIGNTLFKTLRKKTTWIECKISPEGYLYSDLWDRGESIYRIREKLTQEFDELKNAQFKATIFFLNKIAKITFKKKMGIIAQEFGSLFLFRNDFRVFPVGEKGNDYWGLDQRKSQGHSRYLGSRDIMGRVDVFGDEDHFKESSSRDKGLIETPASLALNECVVFKCIKRFERYVVGVTWSDLLDKEYDTNERMKLDSNRAKIIDLIGDIANSKDIELLDYNKDIVSIIGEKSSEFEPTLMTLRKMAGRLGDNSLIQQINRAEVTLKNAKKAEEEALAFADREMMSRRNAEKAAAEAQRQKELLEKNLAEEKKKTSFITTSTSRDKEQLENFIHQIIIYASNNRQLVVNQLKLIASKEGEEWAKEKDTFSKLREGIDKIISTSRYLTSANFRLISSKVDGDLARFVSEHLSIMAPTFSSGIGISCSALAKEFKMTFPPIEVGMIFDNLISNAKKARASKIDFQMATDGKVLVITATDNGNGLSPDITDPERIFERGYTRTNGSGLGLNFCREQMNALGGEIKVSEIQPKNGFSLTLKFAINPTQTHIQDSGK